MYSRYVSYSSPCIAIRIVFVTWCIRSSPSKQGIIKIILTRLHCDLCRAGLVNAHSTNPVRHLVAFRLQHRGPERTRLASATTPVVSINSRGVSFSATRGKTRSTLSSHHMPLGASSRTWAISQWTMPVYLRREVRSFFLLFGNLPPKELICVDVVTELIAYEG